MRKKPPQPRPAPTLTYTLSVAPSYANLSGASLPGLSLDGFIGMGWHGRVGLGLSGELASVFELGSSPDEDLTYLWWRFQLATHGRSGKRGRFAWRAGWGAGLVSLPGYPDSTIPTALTTSLRLGYWHQNPVRKTNLLIAGQVGFDLALHHNVETLLTAGLHVGFGRLSD